jgi:DNA polymerase-1
MFSFSKKGKNQKSMRDVELEEIKEYAVEDADVTLQLKEIFTLELDKTGTKKLFMEIEIPLVKVLADMEKEGIRVDVDFLKSLRKH